MVAPMTLENRALAGWTSCRIFLEILFVRSFLFRQFRVRGFTNLIIPMPSTFAHAAKGKMAL